MSKLSVFSQIIKLIPRHYFEASVAFYEADKNTRTLNSWTWFGALLFSQLSGHDSLRALETVFCLGQPMIGKLGFLPIKRSTFSDANASRPAELLEDVFRYCLTLVKPTKSSQQFKDINFPVYLMDSTFIELCLSLCPWSHYSKYRSEDSSSYGGIKLHTAIDLTGHLPEFVVIKAGSEATNSDLTIAREHIEFSSGSMVVFDRGYWSLSYFNDLNTNGIFFVTRPKFKTMKFRVAESRSVDKLTGLRCDQTIYFNSKHTKGLYKGALRRVSFIDPDTGKRFTFITNHFDLPALQICRLYKSRWQVELFFRTLKQHLKVKKFIGLNENAVKAQIYAALICYVLVKYLKQTSRSTLSMPEIMAVVGTLLLMKLNIIELLGERPQTTRHPTPPSLQLDLLYFPSG